MIVRLGEEVDGWVAILADGGKVARAPYYLAPYYTAARDADCA